MSPGQEVEAPPKDGGFNFGSVEEKMFVSQYLGGLPGEGKAVTSGSPVFLGSQKAMFSNIEMNIFIPRDPYVLNSEFRLQDMIEDHLDKLDRMQYYVSLYLLKNILNLV
jgi:hypothetical protein